MYIMLDGMYVTMSISTGLYPNLDLWTANKLQLQLHGKVKGSSVNYVQKYHSIYISAWHSWDPQDYMEMVFDSYWLQLLPGLWWKQNSMFANISCFTYGIHTNITEQIPSTIHSFSISDSRFWNTKVHHHVHRALSLNPILSQMTPSPTLKS